MAIPLNDNIKVVAPKPSDPRYFHPDNRPWVSILEVNNTIPLVERFIGLTVNVNSVEYWYKNDVENVDLIEFIDETNLNNEIQNRQEADAAILVQVNAVTTGLIYKTPVATFVDLATTYPTPSQYWAAMVIDEGFVYSYNGSAWVNTGLSAFPSDVATQTDLIPKLDKIIGKNKLNINDADVILNAFISDNGNLNIGATPSFNLAVSGFIPISTGQTLKANFATPNVSAMLYDSNKIAITSTATATGATTITQSGVGVYARFSYYSNISNLQVEVGTVSTSYDPYTEYQPLNDLGYKVEELESGNLHLNFVDKASTNGFVATDGVTINSDANWLHSNLIDIDDISVFGINALGHPAVNLVSFYDISGAFISGLNGTAELVAIIQNLNVPIGTASFRICVSKQILGTYDNKIIATTSVPFVINTLKEELDLRKIITISQNFDANEKDIALENIGAKKTVDFVNQIPNLFTRVGYLNTSGVLQTDSNWLSTPLIDLETIEKIDYSLRTFTSVGTVCFYDKQEVFISCLSGSIHQLLTTYSSFPSGAKFVAFTANNISTFLPSTTIPEKKEQFFNIIFKTQETVDVLLENFNKTQIETNQYDKCSITGYINISGVVAGIYDTNWKHSDLIKIDGTTIDFDIIGNTAVNTLSFYDSKFKYINGVVASTDGVPFIDSITPPVTARYYRICTPSQTFVPYKNAFVRQSINLLSKIEMSTFNEVYKSVKGLDLAGKKIVLYGDSISSNRYAWYKEWLELYTGATVVRGGFAGYNTYLLARDTQLNTVFAENPDLIICLMGANDEGNAGSVGTFGMFNDEPVVAETDINGDGSDAFKYIQGISHIIRVIKKQYEDIRERANLTGTETEIEKSAKIDAVQKVNLVFCTPFTEKRNNDADPYSKPENWFRKRNAVIEACYKYQVHCIDLFNTLDIDWSLEPYYTSPTDEVTNNGIYTMDGLHLNKYGYQKAAQIICADFGIETNYSKFTNYISKVIGKNLFDKTKITNNKFLNADGTLPTLNGYFVSDFISVLPSTVYSVTNIGSNSGGAFNLFFNASKGIISDESGSSIGTSFTTPSNCYFIRLSGGDNTLLNSVQVERANAPTSYQAFTEYKPVDDLRDEMIVADAALQADIDQNAIDILDRVSKVAGKNLFNKTTITNNKYLNDDGATLSNLTGYFVTDFIVISPSTQYSLTNIGSNAGGASNCFYNANKAIVSYVSGGSIGATFTSPANAYFIRFTGGDNTLLDSAQVEQNSSATSYEPFTEFKPLTDLQLQVEDLQTQVNDIEVTPVEVVLPSKMYFGKDKNVGIYFQNILRKNLNDPTSVFFNTGVHWENQVQLQFYAAATNQNFTTQVVQNLKKGQLKTINYDVIDGAANSGKTINLFGVGDSFTDIAKWVKELKTLLVADGVTVNQIGTQSNTLDGVKTYMEALSGGRMQNFMLDTTAGVAKIVEVNGMTTMPDVAYPGARYLDDNGNEWLVRGGKIDGSGNGKIRVTKWQATTGDFTTFPPTGNLTKVESGWIGDNVISYLNPTNAYFSPFINPSTGLFDIAYYFTFWGYSNPDVIVIQYTFNDVPLWATDSQLNNLVQNNWKFVADAIHTAYPSCKVIFSVEPWGAINAGNLDWNGRKFSFLRFTELLLVQFEANNAYNTWVKIAPSYAFVDMINGYWNTGAPFLQAPSPRYPDVKEPQSGDGVHPSIGMLQIADCVYPIISALI